MTTTSFTNLITLTDAAWFNDVDKAAYAYLTGVAGTNTITGTGSAALSAYVAGQEFRFIPAATNTGATTLNITQSGASALGAKNVYFNGAACAGGEIKIGVPCIVVYDGTQFNIVSSIVPALQADQEAGTSASLAVTPLRQQYHPSATKVWIEGNMAGGNNASFNVASVTDNATGDVTITYTTAMSSASYTRIATTRSQNTYTIMDDSRNAQSASYERLIILDTGSSLVDPVGFYFAAYGDQ